MLKRLLCLGAIDLDLSCVDPVLIKAGYAGIDGPDMVPVATYRDGEETCYLPGTSLKGVLRAHTERIIRTLRPEMVCVPYLQREEDASPEEDLHLSCGKYLAQQTDSCGIYRLSCPACRTFGSLQFAGRATISDAYPTGGAPIVEDRDGVGIDRKTGGAVTGAKFELRVVTQGTFRATITIRNFESWQLGLLHLLLLDFEDEILRIGSGKSRGLGRVKGAVQRYHLVYWSDPSHLVGIEALVSQEEKERYGLFDPGDPPPISLPPPDHHRGLRRIYDGSEKWREWTDPLVAAFNAFLERGYGASTWRASIEAATRNSNG